MFVHDLIKIKYTHLGYLMNYPYHMVSDAEMFEAFLKEDGYFNANYPCVNPNLQSVYDTLVDAIHYHIDKYLSESIPLPNWVYAFMMGSVISVNSSDAEITELLNLFNIPVEENLELRFTPELAEQCYDISRMWVRKLPADSFRPASIFGEPHVIKSLRLRAAAEPEEDYAIS